MFTLEDEIYFYQGHDFFDYSPINEQPFFIVKDDEILDSIKLLFYSIKESVPIQIVVDNHVINDLFW